jgi:hypothetical protein
MGRTAGALNKNKNIPPMENKNIIISQGDSEDIFLSDVLDKHKFWKTRATALKTDGKDASREQEYATAYRLLLNKFSTIDKADIE